MKAKLFPRSMTDVLLVFFVFWFGSSVGDYLLTIGISKPLYMYIVLIAIGLLYALEQSAAMGSWFVLRDRWSRRLLLWLLAYLAYGAVTFIESSQSAVAIQALITLFEVTLMAAAFTVLMSHQRHVDQATTAFALLALIASGLNLFDFIVPTFTNVPGRAAGLYINANISGCIIALAMLCGIEAVPRRLRWPFMLACGVGVCVTFSREDWLLWGLAVALLGRQLSTGNLRWRLFVTAACTLLGIWFLFAIFFGDIGKLVMGTALTRYFDLNDLSRLGVLSSSLSGFAAEQRLHAALYTLHMFPSAPLLGHGIGYIYEWGFPVGPHDMYLRFLAEGGVIGLLLYLALMGLLWLGSAGIDRILALLVIVEGFFSHNMLEQPSMVLIMVFLLLRSATRRQEQRDTAFVSARIVSKGVARHHGIG